MCKVSEAAVHFGIELYGAALAGHFGARLDAESGRVAVGGYYVEALAGRSRACHEGEYCRAVLHYMQWREPGSISQACPMSRRLKPCSSKALAYGFNCPEIHGRRVEKRAEVGNVVHRGIVVQSSF